MYNLLFKETENREEWVSEWMIKQYSRYILIYNNCYMFI